MGKKKLLPGQKSPIVRSTTAKPLPGLEETALTEGMGQGVSITPSGLGDVLRLGLDTIGSLIG